MLRAGSDGVLKEVAKLDGPVVEALYASAGGKAMAWGLAVDDQGTVYAAVPALGETLKIGADGKRTTIARSEKGWATVGVAVSGRAVFLLESKTTERNNYGPRVRRVMPGGSPQLLGLINGE